MSTPDAKEQWEQRYAESDRIWSGRVNVRLAEVVSPLPAGHALDLGCGEGADACWLAEHGWTVVAVDISETALQPPPRPRDWPTGSRSSSTTCLTVSRTARSI
jgi:SAM-dependent methyltransferase